jgi:hypothetical protein
MNEALSWYYSLGSNAKIGTVPINLPESQLNRSMWSPADYVMEAEVFILGS